MKYFINPYQAVKAIPVRYGLAQALLLMLVPSFSIMCAWDNPMTSTRINMTKLNSSERIDAVIITQMQYEGAQDWQAALAVYIARIETANYKQITGNNIFNTKCSGYATCHAKKDDCGNRKCSFRTYANKYLAVRDHYSKVMPKFYSADVASTLLKMSDKRGYDYATDGRAYLPTTRNLQKIEQIKEIVASFARD